MELVWAQWLTSDTCSACAGHSGAAGSPEWASEWGLCERPAPLPGPCLYDQAPPREHETILSPRTDSLAGSEAGQLGTQLGRRKVKTRPVS